MIESRALSPAFLFVRAHNGGMSKIARNDPCPCGSGKKYKQCCIDKPQGAQIGAARAPVLSLAQQYQAGVQAFQRGRFAEAEAVLKAAAKVAPKNADVQHLLAAVYQATQQWSACESAIALACKLDPKNPRIQFTAADVAHRQGRVDAAIAHYRAALGVQPDLVEAWFNLGNALRDAGRLADACDAYERAIKLRPQFVEALCNLGDVRRQQSRYADALVVYERALEAQPHLGAIHSKKGLALQRLSRLPEALEAFEQASALAPQDAQAFSNWLLASQYDPSLSAAALFERHRQFAERFEQPLATRRYTHAAWQCAGRRIRLGYVSPDLRKHSVASFIEPVMLGHDRSRFEVHAYYSNAFQDEVTARIRAGVEHWHDVAALSDEALAQRIHADGIDVLVDLSGHTAGNRLRAFALKPAPVQVTWIGYPGTTGLQSMDYRLTDACLDPEGVGGVHYTESLVRLSTYSYFSPPAGAPDVGDLPCGRRGHMTFACLNNTAKINAQVLALWAQVLHAVPSSELIIGNADEPAWRDWVLTVMGSHGIEAQRIVLKPRLSSQDYLALHQDIDLNLDPFPWNGGTTTMLGLWMGVPVITFAGDRPASRLGVSSLAYAGLEGFVATSPADYVRLAQAWAENPPDLAVVRAGLRDRMRAALDKPAHDLVAEVERAYESMCQRFAAPS